MGADRHILQTPFRFSGRFRRFRWNRIHRSIGYPTTVLEPTLTWIEVADTAIKVGLGALISGVIGYVVLKARQRGDVVIEQHRRQREMIEEVTNLLDDVVFEIQDFTARIFRDVGDEHIRPFPEAEAQLVRERFSKASRDIRRIHTKLILLQEQDAISHMAATASALTLLLAQVQTPNSGLTGREVNTEALKIANLAANVHRALAPAYRSTI